MKLFLSSSDVGHPSGFKYMKLFGNKYYLYSYYNIRGKKRLPEYLSVDGEVFIDSGAHTLQKPGNSVDWDLFIHEYIQFINQYKQFIDYIVELDVENKIGLALVEKYREQITQETGIEPIVVWHRDRGFDYLKYMAKTYKYIGFSGFVEDKTGEEEVPSRFINAFCKIAHDNGSKVHAFGYTRKDLSTKHFDSADSSSWSMGMRFGSLDKFNGNQITKFKMIKNYGDKYEYINKWNTREWISYQRYLDTITSGVRYQSSNIQNGGVL